MLTFKLLLSVYLALVAAALISRPPNNLIQSSPLKNELVADLGRSMHPINPQDHPDWAGDFNLDDCKRANGFMNGRLPTTIPREGLSFGRGSGR